MTINNDNDVKDKTEVDSDQLNLTFGELIVVFWICFIGLFAFILGKPYVTYLVEYNGTELSSLTRNQAFVISMDRENIRTEFVVQEQKITENTTQMDFKVCARSSNHKKEEICFIPTTLNVKQDIACTSCPENSSSKYFLYFKTDNKLPENENSYNVSLFYKDTLLTTKLLTIE